MPVQPISLTDNNKYIDRRKIFHDKLNVKIFDNNKEISSYGDLSIEKTILCYRRTESTTTISSKRLKLLQEDANVNNRKSQRKSNVDGERGSLSPDRFQHVWNLNLRRILLEDTFHIPVGTKVFMAVDESCDFLVLQNLIPASARDEVRKSVSIK